MKLFGFIIQSKSATHPLSFLPLRKSLSAAFLTASAKAGFPCSRILAIVLDLRWPSMLRMVGMMLPFLRSSSLKKSASFLKSGVSAFSSFPAAVGSASADFLSELCKEFFSLSSSSLLSSLLCITLVSASLFICNTFVSALCHLLLTASLLFSRILSLSSIASIMRGQVRHAPLLSNRPISVIDLTNSSEICVWKRIMSRSSRRILPPCSYIISTRHQ